MFKKLSLLLALVSLAACAVPSVASAFGVTSKSGVLAPVGAATTETSTNFTLVSSILGEISCQEVAVTAELRENKVTSVEADGILPGTAVNCENNGAAVQVTDFTYQKLLLGKTNLTSLTFKLDVRGLVCHYEAAGLTVKYTAGTSVTEVSGALKVAPAACGTTKLEADWTMKISGTPVILD